MTTRRLRPPTCAVHLTVARLGADEPDRTRVASSRRCDPTWTRASVRLRWVAEVLGDAEPPAPLEVVVAGVVVVLPAPPPPEEPVEVPGVVVVAGGGGAVVVGSGADVVVGGGGGGGGGGEPLSATTPKSCTQ